MGSLHAMLTCTVFSCFLFFKLVNLHKISFEDNDNVKDVLIKKNGTADVRFGDNVVLECKFNKPVLCGWQRRGVLILTGGRYAYKNGHMHGQETDDCSMTITNVQELDIGEWICESLGTSEKHAEMGSFATLSKAKRNENPKPTTRKTMPRKTELIPSEAGTTTTADTVADNTTTDFEDNSSWVLSQGSVIIILVVLLTAVLLLSAALFSVIYLHKQSIRKNIEQNTKITSPEEITKLNEEV